MHSSAKRQEAASPALGIMLMLAITLILAVLVLLMFRLPYLYDPSVPAIFKITNIKHDQNGIRNFDSYMVVMNTGTTSYRNSNLYAEIYRNGEKLDCRIETLNGHDFIPTHHYKIQTMGGPGSQGFFWNPVEMIFVDFRDGTFHPGDQVTFEVYDNTTRQLLSRHTYTA
ncbi:type IV pilin N-terminal domain-containing protein [Methanoregula boonei]|nr:type IV pilin N-terminal domain-containing protein [Methanoregula boonei]